MTVRHQLPRLLALATLAISSAAMAQYNGHDDHHGDNHRDDRHDDHRGGPRPEAHRDIHEYHRYARGDRLPPDYRSRQYVIEDYRPYRLAPPPRGYQWISVGPDFFLAAVTTGVIAQVILGGR
jgi:Ni/Co efflux regulator RcnB